MKPGAFRAFSRLREKAPWRNPSRHLTSDPAVRSAFWAGLCLLGALSAAPAKAVVSGFTGTFDPTTWYVINTDPADTLNSPDYICGGDPGQNAVACVEDYTTNTGDFTLLGSEEGLAGGGTGNTLSQTTLYFTNSNWRPYLITFDWSFSGPGGDPLVSDQYARILVNPGFIDTAGSQGYQYQSAPGDEFSGESAIVYIPPGATLEFSVFTLNNGAVPVLSITGFDAVEVPAPLPLAGSTSVFLFSRRLRRRQRCASTQMGILRANNPIAMNVTSLRSSLQRQRAVQRYGELLARPLPLPPALHQGSEAKPGAKSGLRSSE